MRQRDNTAFAQIKRYWRCICNTLAYRAGILARAINLQYEHTSAVVGCPHVAHGWSSA
jgi:hypothetical protein